jgi:hypothetical protein
MTEQGIKEGVVELDRYNHQITGRTDSPYPYTSALFAMEPNVPRALWQVERPSQGLGTTTGIDYLLQINPGEQQGAFAFATIQSFLEKLTEGEKVRDFRLDGVHVFPISLSHGLDFPTVELLKELVEALASTIVTHLSNDE